MNLQRDTFEKNKKTYTTSQKGETELEVEKGNWNYDTNTKQVAMMKRQNKQK